MSRPPIYENLAERIRQDIVPYHDGWEIPSVRSLARLHKVAPDTVRKALRVLEREGQIAKRGRGSCYIRRYERNRLQFCKPFPSVGVLSYMGISFTTDDYKDCLLRSFVTALQHAKIPVTILPRPQDLDMQLVPGGVALVAPGECRFSAAVFLSGAPDSTLAAMVRTGAVVMTLDYLSELPGVDSVVVDCEAEARMVVSYLARLGHRCIGFLAARYILSPLHWLDGLDPDAVRFRRAMLQAKQSTGLNDSPAYHQEYQMQASHSDGPVRVAVRRLWQLQPPPTALVCFDPITAEQAKESLHERGLACPGQVSILARSNVCPARPAFTLSASNPQQIAVAAVGHLIKRLTDSTVVPTKLQFPTTLIDGPSTGPAPSRAGAGPHAGTRRS